MDSKEIGKIFEDPSNSQESKPQQNTHVDKKKNANDNLHTNENELPGEFRVENALIGIIGIGEYDDDQNLDGVRYDYKNIISTFVGTYKHKILYQLDDGSLIYSNDIKEILESKSNFKLRWSEQDIDDYTMEYRKHVINNKHDAVIFFIEGHGNSDSELIPSIYNDDNDDNVDIAQLIYHFKPNGSPWVNCKDNYKETQTEFESKHLCRIPKIVFVDICRGQTTLKPIKLCINNQSTKPEINDGNNNNNNNSNNNINIKCGEHDEAKYTSEDANICLTYANAGGYAVIGGSKGSQFTSSVCKVFDDKSTVEKSELLEIIKKIRKKQK